MIRSPAVKETKRLNRFSSGDRRSVYEKSFPVNKLRLMAMAIKKKAPSKKSAPAKKAGPKARAVKAKAPAKKAVKSASKKDPIAQLSRLHQAAVKHVEKIRKSLDKAILAEEKSATRLNVAITKAEAKAAKAVAKANKSSAVSQAPSETSPE
ncbi:MAG: hypothetical protein EB015_09785 [Methylocystaceae bacterium]|nr:hypothetical protein [Methylocystaceae bacterium]